MDASIGSLVLIALGVVGLIVFLIVFFNSRCLGSKIFCNYLLKRNYTVNQSCSKIS